MTFYKRISLMPQVAAVVLLVLAAGCGRDKAPVASGKPTSEKAGSAVAERMADTSYRARLQSAVKNQKSLARERAEVARGLELQRRRARAALAAGATEAQVLAELEKNPVKYPEWAHLQARERALEAAAVRERAAARDVVRTRIAEQRAAETAKPAGK